MRYNATAKPALAQKLRPGAGAWPLTPGHLVRVVFNLLALRRARRRLGHLDTHLLKDIGLSEAEAQREAERPVWDAPGHWFR